jgi:hypothetical protein
MRSLTSIQAVFQQEFMTGAQRLVIFRCPRGNPAYTRNVKSLAEGQTAWWTFADTRQVDGVVVLLDSLREDRIEVWYGRVGENSGRVRQHPNSTAWLFQVEGRFTLLGLIQAPTMEKFLGRKPGRSSTYVDRVTSELDIPLFLNPGPDNPARGFDDENTMDRAMAYPGAYRPGTRHALAIRALRLWLESRKYKSLDNRTGYHDIHAFTPEGEPELFELKPDSAPQSVYTAVGQLLMYEMWIGTSRKVIVLPEEPSTTKMWLKKLTALNIDLITYTVDGDGKLHLFTEVPRPGQPVL